MSLSDPMETWKWDVLIGGWSSVSPEPRTRKEVVFWSQKVDGGSRCEERGSAEAKAEDDLNPCVMSELRARENVRPVWATWQTLSPKSVIKLKL